MFKQKMVIEQLRKELAPDQEDNYNMNVIEEKDKEIQSLKDKLKGIKLVTDQIMQDHQQLLEER